MKPLGIIEPDRLKLMPTDCHAAHEFCFRLHDQMVQLLVDGEAKEVNSVTIKLDSPEDIQKFQEFDDPIGYFLNTGQDKISRLIVLNHLKVALFSDFLHFIHEALKALEKRKFSVAMALLRKPLRENLMFATWLKADQDDFYTRLKESPADLMENRHLTPTRKIELFEEAIKASKGTDFAKAEKLFNIIFDKKNAYGFATLFDKANHLVTSHPAMRTEELNLNFIFKNPSDNDLFQTVYVDLAYVLMYANVLMISLYSEMSAVEESYLDYILLTSIGSYDSLFGEGRNEIAAELNKTLKEFLRCPHCGMRVSIRKSNAARFFITETMDCRHCGEDHHFPFHWLLSKTKFRITEKESQIHK